MTKDDIDSENLDALLGMQRGDVEPLIALLEDVERPLHADVRAWLAMMLVGKPDESRWWLECKRHPGFPPSDKLEQSARVLTMGYEIHKKFSGGMTITEAQAEVGQQFGLETRSVQ